MTRPRWAAAVSAVIMSLGLCGVVVFAASSLSVPTSDGARVLAADPSQVPGCDVDPAGPCEEPEPIVTVTVTSTPASPPPPPPPPQKTVTTTVTVPAPSHSPKPKPKPRPKSKVPAVQMPRPTAPPVVQPPVVQPPTTPALDLPSPSPASASPAPEPVFPTPDQTPTGVASPQPTPAEVFEDTAPASVPYEIRNAGSDFNAPELSRQLGIPALILVLLVLFAVLILEGRLRRLAHASAVRRAGPRPVAPVGYPAGPAYPAAPGFPPPVYQGGTAYAPIISFVPMQMYGTPYPQGYPSQPYPQLYDQPMAMPEPDPEPPVGYGGQPMAMPEPDPEPPAGSVPPFVPEPSAGGRRPGVFPGPPFPDEPSRSGDRGGRPPSGAGSAASAKTAAYPLPGQEAGTKRRGLFRRSS